MAVINLSIAFYCSFEDPFILIPTYVGQCWAHETVLFTQPRENNQITLMVEIEILVFLSLSSTFLNLLELYVCDV